MASTDSNSNSNNSTKSTTTTTPQMANHKNTATSSSTTMPPSPTPSMVALMNDDDLPSHVNTRDQLEGLPPECLSGEPYYAKPLRHIDDQGNEYHYHLNPMLYSVAFILIVELLERFSFYGIYYTQTMYLTGVYNEDWNAGLTSVDAASFVSISTAVAYTTPFVGAILADSVLGDYYSILGGSTLLYLPGILLVALTTIPHLLGDHFNMPALASAVLFLWPMGTGIVKSVVNVFGAKQFHPLLQSAMIERYYVNFYMSINIGALAGIALVPILAQTNVTRAYLVPFGLLLMGVVIFVSGTPRYVISQPRHDLFQTTKSKQAELEIPGMPPSIPLSTIFRITLLIVPFCIAYSQMPTTFIVQGTVMRKAFGFIDAATMNGLDAISVLLLGYITGNVIYPALAKRDIKIPTTYKFAIGSFLGSFAILWALLVEHWIHQAYHHNNNGDSISVLWQAPSYILIGWGEIFAVSAAYEVAFTASSPETKALASATNIFCVGGIPNVICIFLYQVCQGWFRNARGDTNLAHLDDYATARVSNYFWVLYSILLLGVALNLYSPVRRFVESTEQQAADLVKTPILRRTPIMGRKPREHVEGAAYADEESPLLLNKQAKTSLLKAQQHQQYLKYGKGPVLYKMGSMRAGPSLSHKEPKKKAIKKSYIPKLYGGAVAAAAGNEPGAATPRGSPSTLMPPGSLKSKKALGHRSESS